MYKIVIADDDEIQLQGMCCAFPWAELDIEVAAGVDDGDKALEAVVEMRADILLTDIKMSNMDGLHLTEQIRRLSPDTRVVIMSAYDDFHFAQKALRLGVDDYLLKPVDLHQMRETMHQIVFQKEEEKRRAEAEKRSKRLGEMVPADEEILEETFFQNVLNRTYSREACKRLETPYLHCPRQKWMVLEAVFEGLEESTGKHKVLTEVSSQWDYRYVRSLGYHLICCYGTEHELPEKVERFKEECREQLRIVEPSASVTFIEGSVVSELYYLSLSYEKILQIRSYEFDGKNNGDLSEKDLDRYFNENHTVNKTLAEYLAKLVSMGNTDMLPEYVDKLKNNLKYAGNDSILMLSFSLSAILGELKGTAGLADKGENGLDELYYRIIRQNSLDEAMELLESELQRLAETARGQESITVRQSVQRACNYIEEHFSDPALRIGEVAVEVGLSQSYFSAVFTEVTGESFTDYLIERRMKEAQLLLMNSDYKIQEIGYKAGYDNPAYFSAAFKKFTGVSVSRYKDMIKREFD